MKSVTLKDVAAHAGVSPTTVSLYLGGTDRVCSEDTARKIRAAVVELQYAKGMAAISRREAAGGSAPTALLAPPQQQAPTLPHGSPLLAGGSATLPRFDDPAYAPGAQGSAYAARALRTVGFCVPITAAPNDPVELARTELADEIWRGAVEAAEWEEHRLLSYPPQVRNGTSPLPFLDGSISGLVLAAARNDPRPVRLVESGLPVVLVGRSLDVPHGCGAVAAYENDVVELALGHLESLGHRRIAHLTAAGVVSAAASAGVEGEEGGVHVGAPDGPRHEPSDMLIRRLERYRVGMRRRGSADPALVGEVDAPALAPDGRAGGGDAEVGALLDGWMALPEPPTAVFCANDALALRLMAAAAARGICVPGRLSIVGVGDEPDCRLPEPVPGGVALTSVVLPGAEIGRAAVEMVLRMIDGIPANLARKVLPVNQLAVRASTAAPPQTSPAAGHASG